MRTTAPRPTTSSVILSFDARDLDLLIDALDSHMYWELSDREYRGDGFVHGAGAFDSETIVLIDRARALADRLRHESRRLVAVANDEHD